MDIIVGLFIALIVGGILFVIALGIRGWIKNSNSPIVAIPAQIVAKRSETSGGGNDTSVSTSYYVTFEMEDGERREWSVRSRLFGLLVEGDRGTLTYQGTWFKDFVRTVS